MMHAGIMTQITTMVPWNEHSYLFEGYLKAQAFTLEAWRLFEPSGHIESYLVLVVLLTLKCFS